MNTNGQDYDFDDLHLKYLELCELYKDKMSMHAFGFGLICMVSKMMFDCSPSEDVVRKLLQRGVDAGHHWSRRKGEDCNK